MSALAGVAAKARAALDSCTRARRALQEATGSLEYAAQHLGEALQGVGDHDVAQAPLLMSHAANEAAETYRALIEAESRLRAFLASLGMDATDATTTNTSRHPTRPQHQSAAPSPSTPPTSERIEQLRGELPPPVVRSSGQKTHGRWIAPDGTAQPMISGRDELSSKVNDILKSQGCPRLPARAADDVELKLAALMRERGQADPRMRHITVLINNRPCKGDLSCDELIPVILPEGYSLIVHAPNYRKRFTGGAKPWWR